MSTVMLLHVLFSVFSYMYIHPTKVLLISAYKVLIAATELEKPIWLKM